MEPNETIPWVPIKKPYERERGRRRSNWKDKRERGGDPFFLLFLRLINESEPPPPQEAFPPFDRVGGAEAGVGGLVGPNSNSTIGGLEWIGDQPMPHWNILGWLGPLAPNL